MLVVPPEQLELWTEEEMNRYKIWKDSTITKNSMEDYRQVVININKDKIYDGIEASISFLETHSDFAKLVPFFDVN